MNREIDRDVLAMRDEAKKIKRKAYAKPRTKEPDAPITPVAYSLHQIIQLTTLSRSTIYLMMERGDFPKARKVGGRRVVWNKKEVDSWVAEKIGD